MENKTRKYCKECLQYIESLTNEENEEIWTEHIECIFYKIELSIEYITGFNENPDELLKVYYQLVHNNEVLGYYKIIFTLGLEVIDDTILPSNYFFNNLKFNSED